MIRPCKSCRSLQRLAAFAVLWPLFVYALPGCSGKPQATPASAVSSPSISNSPAKAAVKRVVDPPLPKGQLLADIKQDFQENQNGHRDNEGSGRWWYLASPSANPWMSAAQLMPLEWNSAAGSTRYQAASRGRGSSVSVARGADQALVLTPSSGQAGYAVLRWESGIAGEAAIQGRISKSELAGGDGIEAAVFVDGIQCYRGEIEHYDDDGTVLSLTASVMPGSTIDVVIGVDGPGNHDDDAFDGTRVALSIVRTAASSPPAAPPELAEQIAEIVKQTPTRPLPAESKGGISVALPEVRYRWWRKLFLDALQKRPPQSAQWQGDAERLLDAYARLMGGNSTYDEKCEMAVLGRKLLETGDREPLVALAWSQFLDSSSSTDDRVYLRQKMPGGAELRDGSPMVRFNWQYYLVSIAGGLYSGPRQRLAPWKNDAGVAIDILLAAASEPELTDLDRRMTVRRIDQFVNHQMAQPFRHWLAARFRDQTEVDSWIREIILAREHRYLAWQARGNGAAETVSEAAWKQFNLQRQHAIRHAIQAWTERPGLPEAATEMIALVMAGDGVAGEDERFWLDEALRADFEFDDAYRSYALTLRPRWGGSHERMLAFGRECLATGRFDTRVPEQFERILEDLVEETGGWKDVLSLPGVYDDYVRMLEGYAQAAEDDEQRRKLETQRAAIAWLADRPDETARLIAELGDRLKRGIFDDFGWSFSSVRRALRDAGKLDWGTASPLLDNGIGSAVGRLRFTADGSELTVLSFDAGVSQWNPADGVRRNEDPYRPPAEARALAVFPDGKRVLLLVPDVGGILQAQVVDMKTSQVIHAVPTGDSPAAALAVAPSGSMFAVGDARGLISLYRADDYQPIPWGRLTEFRERIGRIVISADGSALAAAAVDGQVAWWDLPSDLTADVEKLTHRFSVFGLGMKTPSSLEISPDHSLLAISLLDTFVFDAASGERLYIAPGSVAVFSPDSTRLLTAAGRPPRNEAVVRDARTGRKLALLQGGHRTDITAVVFAPDGLTALTSDREGIVRAWDAASGEELSRPLKAQSEK